MKASNKNNKHILNISIILLISIAATFLFAGTGGGVWAIALNIFYGLIIGLSIAFSCHFVSQFFFKKQGWEKHPAKNFSILVVIIAVVILLDLILVNVLWFTITQDLTPLQVLGSSMVRTTIMVEFIIGLIIYLIRVAFVFSQNMETYYTEVSNIKSELAKYKYETLKSQMNPHFLFNTLNTLSGLIYVDVEKSDQFIHHFSKIYRYVLEVQNEDVVNLESELEFIENFLFLNNIRFNNSIETEINVSNMNQFVVPMALQIVFENAIKHNQFNEKNPLKIKLVEENRFIKISNNRTKKEQVEPSTNLGLPNLKARYKQLSDKKLKIEQTDTEFTVYLPILKEAK